MKAKLLFQLCLVLIAITTVGCREKSSPTQEESTQQTEVPKQSTPEQAGPEKTSTENIMSVTAIIVVLCIIFVIGYIIFTQIRYKRR